MTQSTIKMEDRDCMNCLYNPEQRESIDDAPPRCWDCLNAMRVTNVQLPYWKEKPMGKMKEYAMDSVAMYPLNKPLPTTYDVIEKPKHYTEGRTIEPIDAINDWKLNFNLGNAVKYISRAGRKGDKSEDLSKAMFYLKREIEECK